MNRRDFLRKATLTTGAILANGCLYGKTPTTRNKDIQSKYPAKRPPNIIFIMVDDMGWRDAGFMGSTYYETPHIDKLAQQGMVFTQAYACAANCAPSRACLMTGQYTPRHGVYTVANSNRGKSKDRRLIPIKNDTTLDAHFVTIAEALKPAGYVSISIGKWHLGDDPKLGPVGQGFTFNIAGDHSGNPGRGGYFSPYNHKPNLPPGPKGEYLIDRLTNEAVKFINKYKDKPFFLYFPHYAVHTPLMAKKDIKAKYKDKPASNGQHNPTYAAMIDSTDQSVGRIMATLDKLKLTDNTVVFFFSDNGGVKGITSMQPLRGGKGMFYEGGIREPMIVRWPKHVKPGSKCNVPVIEVDFFPTLLEIAGLKKPAGKLLDGVSIMPLLQSQKTVDGRFDRALYWHFPAYLQGNAKGARDKKFRTRPVGVIRKGNWKLLQYFEQWVLDGGWETIDTNNAIELYNLEQDISEAHNLANINKTKRNELLKELIAWQKKVKAPIPTKPNPGYVRPG